MTGYIGSAWVDAAVQEDAKTELVEGCRYAVENEEYNSTLKFTARLAGLRREDHEIVTTWDNGVVLNVWDHFDGFVASPASDSEAVT